MTAAVDTAAETAPVDRDSFASVLESLIPANTGALAVAVSGGADSLALALLLKEWCGDRVGLTALTVDHGLRDESAAEARQVAAWMAPRDIPHHILSWDEGRARRAVAASPHADAREARYALLSDWCREQGIAVLSTAHHADDQVETFLMRLARGSGLEGLSAMRAREDGEAITLVRPLLGFSKAALIATCRARNQPWIEDPSNTNAAFTRTRFRRARAFLAAEGLTDERLLATVAHLQRAQDAIDAAVDDLESRAVRRDELGASVTAKDLLSAPAEVGLRALSRLLTDVSGQTYGPRFDSLARLYARLRGAAPVRVTLHGCVVSTAGENIRIAPETRTTSADL